MERGMVRVVDFVGVGGALAVAKTVSKFPKKRILAALTAQQQQELWH